MNGETEASERDIVWQKMWKTQKGLGELKLGKTLAENAENADFTIPFQ